MALKWHNAGNLKWHCNGLLIGELLAQNRYIVCQNEEQWLNYGFCIISSCHILLKTIVLLVSQQLFGIVVVKPKHHPVFLQYFGYCKSYFESL